MFCMALNTNGKWQISHLAPDLHADVWMHTTCTVFDASTNLIMSTTNHMDFGASLRSIWNGSNSPDES